MNEKKVPFGESPAPGRRHTVPCSFRLPVDAIKFLDNLPGDNRSEKLLGYISHGRAVGYFGAEEGKTNMIEAILTRIERIEKWLNDEVRYGHKRASN